MESIEQVFNGSADFGKKVTCLVSRNGDLIHRVYLQATLPAITNPSGSFKWVDDVGHHLITEAELEIGGQRIDRQTGTWLQIWSELTVAAGHKVGYRKMIGSYPLYDESGAELVTSLQYFDNLDKAATTIYVPLQFWFCRNVGLSLPLIALQYHEVKINITFRRVEQLYIEDTPGDAGVSTLNLQDVSLWVDYIYLDTDERRRFAQVSHEYLVEQTQYTGSESISGGGTTVSSHIKLNFNHPVKELVWVVQHDTLTSSNQWSNFTDTSATNVETCRNPLDAKNPVATSNLQLNGQDRYATRNGEYFNWVQCYQHHTNIPESPGINVYSFALKPEEHQPSGSCNFSRIDNATLVLSVSYLAASLNTVSAQIWVFAVNYNVLRIMSGINRDDNNIVSTCAQQSVAHQVIGYTCNGINDVKPIISQ